MPPAAAAASAALPREELLGIASPLRELLAAAPYAPPEGSSTSIKSLLASLLPFPSQPSTGGARQEAVDLLLLCAAARAASAEAPALHWVPEGLSKGAADAMEEMAAAGGWHGVAEMVVAMMTEAVPPLKAVLKDTNTDAEGDVIGAATPPKEHAVVAAHQFRWLLSQVNYPKLGDLCWLVIPCALTALDHWSPDVKEQGVVSFMHIAKNVKVTELSLYEDAILDACCNYIPADDDLWYHIVEVSVLLLTCTQRSNPRSPWYDRMLSAMLGHLERQPLNQKRRIAWLTLIGPVLDAMGLFLLAHFRLLFSLCFQWMHADDDQTVLLVLERIHTVVKLTWIRKSPYTSRLVDELVLLYKESAMRKSREVIRNHIVETLMLLQKCKGQQFEKAWKKHEVDTDLTLLLSRFNDLCMQDI
ncbi:uncharacterized protein At2g39910 [Brachypodium distachyon]|uniref:Uncharacterized protein n=1 Tax=Brachypodium distachyon TaxID=15368 RepID=I1GWH8_BRADI|nr:uncharacterized protein At2g39910 [Brachypodium distachyon]KQK17320.1 hypothetical protein BRADI_1g33657v3 [Brachypodium distachyon]|eukprot:XP_003560499.1 uncharacterized protein At2g39910 [Brachypodium distachyon]